MASIKDVASEAGVSTATVSRVLTHKPYVTEEVRTRVQMAIDKLGYRRNQVARSLRMQQTTTIGLIVSDIENPFFTQVCRAVEDAALEKGYSLFICNTDSDPHREQMYLQVLQDQNVAGLIYSPTGENNEALQSLVESHVPIVIIDRRISGVDLDTIMINNQECARVLTEHLLQHHPRRIVGLFGTGSTTGKERLKGFKEALRDAQIKPDDSHISMTKSTVAGGYDVAYKLLSDPASQRPDAIIASSALMAAGTCKAIRDLGLTMAQDVRFAAFDETNWTGLVQPGITVIEQPTRDIGRTALELLLKRIEEPSRATCEIILKGRLIIRESCGCDPVS